VFQDFKDQEGQFASSAIGSDTHKQIRSVLNLFRASLITFPGENVMEEAEKFSATYLKEALQRIPSSSLSREVRGFRAPVFQRITSVINLHHIMFDYICVHHIVFVSVCLTVSILSHHIVFVSVCLTVSILSWQIEYVLEYRWHANLPRLEARTYIDVLEEYSINE